MFSELTLSYSDFFLFKYISIQQALAKRSKEKFIELQASGAVSFLRRERTLSTFAGERDLYKIHVQTNLFSAILFFSQMLHTCLHVLFVNTYIYIRTRHHAHFPQGDEKLRKCPWVAVAFTAVVWSSLSYYEGRGGHEIYYAFMYSLKIFPLISFDISFYLRNDVSFSLFFTDRPLLQSLGSLLLSFQI